jgi:hypothetical protein
MNVLIVDEAEMAALADLNANGPGDRELTPAALDDGRMALNADLLNDCAAGKTWEHWHDFLQGLTPASVVTSEFVETVIP